MNVIESWTYEQKGIAMIGVMVAIICIFASLSYLEYKKDNDNAKKNQGSEKGSLKKSNSVWDISAGLRKEELRSSTSFNALDSATLEARVLSPTEFREFKLLKITKVSHNTKLLRFEIPHGKALGLSIGRHIAVRARIHHEGSADSKVMRSYTPTSRPDQLGEIILS